MHIFLTGATGFIGQALTKAMLQRGWSITALVRKPGSPQAQVLSAMGARLVSGDVTERESVRAAMMGADIVVHNAGQLEYGVDRAGEKRMRAVNVDGVENVLGLARELGISRTIYVSTIQAFGRTGSLQRDETFTRNTACQTVYEQTKTDAHEIALQYQQRGLPLIIVCPHQVVGPNDHSVMGFFQRLYVNGLMPPLAWSPKSTVCCVEVNDLAEGISLAAEKGRTGETYILCGDPQNFLEIFKYWQQKPGRFIPRLYLPARIAEVMFAPMEPIMRMFGLPAFFSRETVRVVAANWNFSNKKAKEELGWTHRSFEALWFGTLDGEISLLARRKGQGLIERLKPLDRVD